MILRIDRRQAELPPPSDPDPQGASAVQELLGGKFGEMSTFMNYTYQSFNFRARQKARPFYDLVANIAAEEFGHIELVSTAINTMLTGADISEGAAWRNTQQFIAGGKAALVQDSMGKPWNGDYVNATGDLVEDLTHNFFLETGARNNKLKVYEMVDHPAAGAPRRPAVPRRRAPGRLRAGGRAAHRRRPDQDVPVAPDPDREDPRVPAAHPARRAPEALPLLPVRLPRAGRRVQRPAPGDRRGPRGGR